MMQQWLWVVLGGAAGSLLRFGVQKLLPAPSFPYATLTVNVSGCLLIGMLWAYFQKGALTENERLLWITGFCGGFTTFSALGLESMHMIQAGRWSHFIIYIFLSGALGLLATFLGYKILQ